MAGRFGGRSLPCPDVPGLRPTPDRVREALFSILGDLEGRTVLDLFAGTGALGIEALSRGARRVVLVEGHAGLASEIRQSLVKLGAEAEAEVLCATLPEALTSLSTTEGTFDLVVADPPYAGSIGRETLAHRDFARCLAMQGLAVFEHEATQGRDATPTGLVHVDERRYGSTGLSFFRRPLEARSHTRSEEDSR